MPHACGRSGVGGRARSPQPCRQSAHRPGAQGAGAPAPTIQLLRPALGMAMARQRGNDTSRACTAASAGPVMLRWLGPRCVDSRGKFMRLQCISGASSGALDGTSIVESQGTACIANILCPGCSTSYQLPAYGLGEQRRMAQVLGSPHPQGRPSLAQPQPCTICEVNQQMEDLSLPPPPSVLLQLQTNLY